jgi:hypothetical protein
MALLPLPNPNEAFPPLENGYQFDDGSFIWEYVILREDPLMFLWKKVGTSTSLLANVSADSISTNNLSTDTLTSNTLVSNEITVSNTVISNNITVNTSISIGGTLIANNSTGTTGQTLFANSTGGLYWGTITGVGYAGSKGDLGYAGSKGDIGFVGSQGPAGTFGGAAFNYNFSSNTIHDSTANGYFNFNNTAFTSVSTLFIDYVDLASANSYSFLQTIDDSTSSIKGHFTIREVSNSLNYALFAIVGTHSEDVDHFDIPVTYVSGVTSFTNGTNTIITFARTGDIGDTGYVGSTGFVGSQGQTGYDGSQGVDGYTGSKGNDGFTGSQGYFGSFGYTGSQGVDGYTGSFGETGFTGSTGNDGYTGSAGNDGYVGSQGYAGSQGNDGYTGSFGNTGYDGSQGYTGSQGVDGYTGSIGYTGSQGDIGYTGSFGDTGFVGSQGYDGSFGYTGSSGDLGYTGSQGYTGSKGETGFTGSKGDTGFVGSQGYDGSQGVDGYTGSQGYAGSKGDTGFVGSQGETGFVGSQGGNGFDGSKGTDGFTGSKGDTGFVGSKGTDGYTGSTGTDGYTGSKGDLGYTGSKGDLGYTGSKGTDGFTGSKGDTGFVGSQGVDGYSGSKGDLGYVGSKGDFGYSGSKGDLGYAGSQGNLGYVGSKGDTGFTGSQGKDGSFGGASFEYIYSNDSSDTPNPGYLDFNNSTIGSASILYIPFSDVFGSNSYSFLQTIDDSTSSIKGHFSVADKTNTLNYSLFTITGSITAHTNHFHVPISYVSGTTTLSDGSNVVVTFARTGDIGDTGYTGSTGFVGSKGDTGFTGSTGTDGYTGSKGDLGYSGSTGTNGYTGSKGDLGYAGSKGDLGYSGSAGTDGFTGSKGDLGYAGSKGDFGYTGSQGTQGTFGYAGSKGETGFVGSQGGTGYDGSKGNTGFDGSKGDTGFTGSFGGTGFTGSVGNDGYTGSTGFTGSKGDLGYAGSKGDFGYAGSTGFDGSSGSLGYTGSTGFVGSKGDLGYSGSIGIGYAGSAGVGYTGSASAGYAGSQGGIGYTGSSGGGSAIDTNAQYTFANVITFSNSVNFTGNELNASNVTLFVVPTGNTERQPSVSQGAVRYNIDTNALEFSNTVSWTRIGAAQESFTACTITSDSVTTQSGIINLLQSQSVTVNSGISVGNTTVNTSINAVSMFSGNSTANSIISYTQIGVSNTTANSYVTPFTIFTGNTSSNAMIDLTGGKATLTISDFNITSTGDATFRTTTNHGLQGLGRYIRASINGLTGANYSTLVNGIQNQLIAAFPTQNSINFKVNSLTFPSLKITYYSSNSSGYVTYQTATDHGLFSGANVTIKSVTDTTGYSTFNFVANNIYSIPSSNTFTIYDVKKASETYNIVTSPTSVSTGLMVFSNASKNQAKPVTLTFNLTTTHNILVGSIVTVNLSNGINSSKPGVLFYNNREFIVNGSWSVTSVTSTSITITVGSMVIAISQSIINYSSINGTITANREVLRKVAGTSSTVAPASTGIISPSAGSIILDKPIFISVGNTTATARITPTSIFVGSPTVGSNNILIDQAGIKFNQKGSFLQSYVDGTGIGVSSLDDEDGQIIDGSNKFFANSSLISVGNGAAVSSITSNTIVSPYIKTGDETSGIIISEKTIEIGLISNTVSNTIIDLYSASFPYTVSIGEILYANSISANGNLGSSGQVLASNGSSIYWTDQSSGGGGTTTVVAGVSNAASEYFITNGSNTEFTLLSPIANQNNSIVSLNGLLLVPQVHYTIDSSTITLSSAPYESSILEIRNIEGGSGVASGYRGSRGPIGYTGSAGSGSGSGGASVTTSSTAPVSPSSGDMWWNTEIGTLLIYYNDGNTSQWVSAIPTTSGSGGTASSATVFGYNILFGGN